MSFVSRAGTIALAMCLVACGRVAFDPHGDGGASTGDGATMGDGAIGDGRGGEPLYGRGLYIKASNPTAGDQFGHHVAVSGDGLTIAVGAPLEGMEAGAVYVFHRTGDIWMQEVIVKPNVQEVGDQFGWSVGLSDDGNTLAVGARREDSTSTGINNDPTNNGATSSGAAYVFVRAGTTWSQQAYVKATNTDGGDSYGQSIAISGDGNTLAVGAQLEDSAETMINASGNSNAALSAGAAYVYRRSGTVWSVEAYIKPTNAEAGDEFGGKVALSTTGNALIVGAYREDSVATGVGGNQGDNTATNAGAVYVFTRSGTTWTQAAYVKASNTELGDNFGYDVAISGAGTRIAVTAESESGGSRGINGNQSNGAMTSGAAYVLDGGGTTWTQTAYVKSSNSETGDQLGFCVALAGGGDRLLTGAVDEDSAASGIDGDQTSNAALSSGATYVFREDAPWSQGAYLKATNPGMDDRFGWSCALSNDGGTVVIGAPFEDGSGAGINPASNEGATDSGAIYLVD